ncbi:hypothetical protein DFH01_15880 [Falsiroseomonas bella]|uniref:Acyloxyacyl hydrolase n=1 Tax=Falsiroseomonas bella TaxID=2184016 RepID=A0A317FF25_9PROT|nr:hypothetical protein [Falsiroseomonas bella]PWS36617.1 hypothetical protein DFH01_15880 [Falsiroseomonas bella]
MQLLSLAVRPIACALALAAAAPPAGAQPAPASPAPLAATVPNWWGGLPAGDARIARDSLRNGLTVWIGSVAEDGYLRQIAIQPWNYDWGGDTFYGASYSRRLLRVWTDFAVDFELGAGYRSGQTNSPEAWYAFYLRYDGFPWRDRLYTSFGLSTGINWLNTLPEVETGTPQYPEPHTSRFLHYFSPEIAVGLPHRPQDELVLRYAHRSGMFGLFNGVWEGSNVLQLGYRRRF